MPKPRLSHIDASGKARMVDVSAKPVVARTATAEAYVDMARATLLAIADDAVPKGDVLAAARIAGIMAAKRTGELIPLCHPLALDAVDVEADVPDLSGDSPRVRLRLHATARISAKTGVEMEALAAVTIAALTIYDMCKAIDKTMQIDGVRVVEKTKTAPGKPRRRVARRA